MFCSPLYDLAVIRGLPIVDVCELLGIRVEKHGKNLWCKVRPEKTASVILHEDSNTFYDFGNQRQGSVIDLVQYASSCSVGEAIRFLAKSFGIQPNKDAASLVSKPLSNWEYQNIGLSGDMASKNISFPIESATTDELLDISYLYQVPMNLLRTKHPSLYENIIQDRAVPFVNELRNAYFCEIWNYYDFLCTFHNGALFYDSDKTQEKFAARKATLERAERTLIKAMHNTSLTPPAPRNYDPLHIISLILQGRLAVSVGSLDKDQLAEEASYEGCNILRSEISYDDYYRLNLDTCRHSAIFNGKAVSLSYLDIDREIVELQLNAYLKVQKPALSEQIRIARQSQKEHPAPVNNILASKDLVLQ